MRFRGRSFMAFVLAPSAPLSAWLAEVDKWSRNSPDFFVGRAIIPVALAASPSPAAVGGDPRSSGEGPGLVGEPGIAILAVAIIAITSIIGTTLWIRLTDDRSAEERRSANARRSR